MKIEVLECGVAWVAKNYVGDKVADHEVREFYEVERRRNNVVQVPTLPTPDIAANKELKSDNKEREIFIVDYETEGNESARWNEFVDNSESRIEEQLQRSFFNGYVCRGEMLNFMSTTFMFSKTAGKALSSDLAAISVLRKSLKRRLRSFLAILLVF